MTDTRTLYLSDMRPEFESFTIQPPEVKGFQYSGDLAYEIRSHHLDGAAAIDLLDDMLAIRDLLVDQEGIDGDVLRRALRELSATVVLTAHPTDATRWTVHSALNRIEAWMERAQSRHLSDVERRQGRGD